MYPQVNTNVNYGLITDMTDDNKRLCRDLCKMSLCLTCFCIFYLILFLGVINEELDMDIMNITYF
jgi:hypothetical protein